MTPKEKAQELIDKFSNPIDASEGVFITYNMAKECALICVDEVLKEATQGWEFYTEVKEELEKL